MTRYPYASELVPIRLRHGPDTVPYSSDTTTIDFHILPTRLPSSIITYSDITLHQDVTA